MKKSLAAFSLFLITAVVLPSIVFSQRSSGADSDAVAAITKIYSDQVKADLSNDASFYQNILASDWTGGTSRGTWDTKQSLLSDLKDTKNNKVNSEKMSELKVRVHGDVAIATFKNTYDAIIKGQRYARTVICTDTFQRQNGSWSLLADHCSQAAQ